MTSYKRVEGGGLTVSLNCNISNEQSLLYFMSLFVPFLNSSQKTESSKFSLCSFQILRMESKKKNTFCPPIKKEFLVPGPSCSKSETQENETVKGSIKKERNKKPGNSKQVNV